MEYWILAFAYAACGFATACFVATLPDMDETKCSAAFFIWPIILAILFFLLPGAVAVKIMRRGP